MSSPAVNQPESAKPRSLWIVSSWKDILLFIATPFLVVPLLLRASGQWRIEDISYIVLTFGALGHHAPGLMRAYGDRELFRQYRTRFIVAPIAGIMICYFFTVQTLTGVTLVLILWGIWHFWMQTYGFARIYDAKAGCFDPTTRRLDFALCASVFMTGVLSSDDHLAKIVELMYQSGVPAISASVLEGVRVFGLVSTLIVTVWFLNNFLRLRRRGKPYSPTKLALLAVTSWLLWFALIYLNNIILGLAMLEVVHDIQYLTIVWVFNNNRVNKDQVGGFTRFLFRRSGAMIGLYIGLVIAYGSIRLVADNVSSEALQRILLSVIATSNMLHFYYDGFIWKVRDAKTRASLGVNGGKASNTAMIAGWKHGLKWVVPGLILLFLGVRESSSKLSYRDIAEMVVESVPNSPRAHTMLADELITENVSYYGAIDHAQKAIELGSDSYLPYKVIGFARGQMGQLEKSVASFQKSLEINPDQVWTAYNLGNAVLELGRIDDAMNRFRTVLELDPERTVAHCYLSEGYKRLGDEEKSRLHRGLATKIDPEEADKLLDLAREQFDRVLDRKRVTEPEK